jgi:acetyltransferase-like isoleucine patch superfamily enzyme
MASQRLLSRLKNFVSRRVARSVQFARIQVYRFLSSAQVDNRGATFFQPVLISGQGKVILGRCQLGVWPSPHFFSGHIYIEVRDKNAVVEIGDRVVVNNNVVIVAERSRIAIGDDTLIGTEVSIYDSDFHHLSPVLRNSGAHEAAPVTIGQNVFIGARVTILKGCEIGRNAVIANGSVVTKSISDDVIAGGVPARVLRSFSEDA